VLFLAAGSDLDSTRRRWRTAVGSVRDVLVPPTCGGPTNKSLLAEDSVGRRQDNGDAMTRVRGGAERTGGDGDRVDRRAEELLRWAYQDACANFVTLVALGELISGWDVDVDARMKTCDRLHAVIGRYPRLNRGVSSVTCCCKISKLR